MRLSPQPRTLVLFSWSTFLATGSVIFAIYWMQILHPHFLPLTLCLLLQAVATVCLVLWGLPKLVRGPDRLHTLGWLLLGIIPVGAIASVATWGVWMIAIREFRHPLLMTVVRPATAALMDLDARLRYPHRVFGKHVVMLTDNTDGAQESVQAMDRHIERMVKLLGQTCRARVHWVRGSLLGVAGVSYQGLALGSPSQPVSQQVDAHEVAHFAIEHLCPLRANPPKLLIEGWAESQTEYQPGLLAENAWKLKQNGHNLSLADLTSNKYYSNSSSRSYDQGGALAEYLLRVYGGEKFFTLYTTCQPESFAQDCQTVLGVSLDDLDRDYWADIEARVNSAEHRLQHHPLTSVRLAKGVDRAEWDYVAREHWQAFERAAQRYRHAQYSMELKRHSTGLIRYQFYKDGPRVRMERSEQQGANRLVEVEVATPAFSFSSSKREGRDESSFAGWTTAEKPYVVIWANINAPTSPPVGQYYLSHWKEGSNASLSERPLVTALTKINTDGHIRWRIDYETVRGLVVQEKWSGSCLLDPDRHWTIQSDEMQITETGKAPYQKSVSLDYAPDQEGVPVMRTCQISSPDRTPGSTHHEPETWTLTNVKFTSTPESEFTPAAFGIQASTISPVNPVPWVVRILSGSTLAILVGACGLLFATTPLTARRPAPMPPI